jgi:hypothetical protein
MDTYWFESVDGKRTSSVGPKSWLSKTYSVYLWKKSSRTRSSSREDRYTEKREALKAAREWVA